MATYICTVCGFIYDESKGHSQTKIEPGTKFKDIPDSWVCPVCFAKKDVFKKQ